jgi:hypothetical protein
VSIPSVAGEEFTLTADISYEACDGTESANVQASQAVFVDPYIGTDWQTLAIAPEYYDDLEADQEAPGELTAQERVVELDLSDWADAFDFQLRFSDYWPADGWGALLWEIEILADGEVAHQFETATDEEEDYIYEDNNSNTDAFDWRFADANSSWTYQFDVPEDTSELTAVLTIANGFLVEGREGLERE